MEKKSQIFIAGSATLVGTALMRRLKEAGCLCVKSDGETGCDLRNFSEVDHWFKKNRPEYVFLMGGKSGGIDANQKFPAELIHDNLLINNHVIHSAYQHSVKKLFYLASSCCYPKHCPQPIKEEYLLTGPFEPTNEAYAVAKLAGLMMCRAYAQQYGVKFITGIVSNPFGPGDDFHPTNSHVFAALLLKIHEAKKNRVPSIEIWGTGKPRRDFIYVDDVADACIHLMENYEGVMPINIGGGRDLSIRELTTEIMEVLGYSGKVIFNSDAPDGMPLKVLDATRLIKLGWHPKTDFRKAIELTYEWFLRRAT